LKNEQVNVGIYIRSSKRKRTLNTDNDDDDDDEDDENDDDMYEPQARTAHIRNG
jgi:hypothetical protein